MENKGCCPVTNATEKTSCSTEKGACDTGPCGPKKCCFGTIIKGAFIGAVVMFIYFAASWMLLPWHKTTMMGFADEGAVASTLLKNAPASGIYTLPAMPKDEASKPGMVKPFAFVSVFADGVDWKNMSPVPCMLKAFLFYLFAAALLTKLLKKVPEGCCPIFCSVVIGTLIALFSYVPNMIWFNFPVGYSLLGMADVIIAVTLAGLAISCCALKNGPCSKSKCSTDKGSCGPTAAPGPGSCGDKKGGCD